MYMCVCMCVHIYVYIFVIMRFHLVRESGLGGLCKSVYLCYPAHTVDDTLGKGYRVRKRKDQETLLKQVEEDEQRQRKNGQRVGEKPEEGRALGAKQGESNYIQESC